MTRLKHYILILIASLSLVFMPCEVYASELSCDGSGGVSGGELYDSSNACAKTGVEHIFSTVVCDVVLVINSILGKVYCGIQYALLGTIRIMLTLFVAIYGAMILMGMAQLNARDGVTRMVKLAFVWAFATQSSWGIHVIFGGFMAIIVDTTSWIMAPLSNVGSGVGISNIPNSNNVMDLYNFLDGLVYGVLSGGLLKDNMKVIGFFVAMALAYPPMFGAAAWWALTTFKVLLGAVVSFLMALAAIAFLVALSPIFLSLMLYQSTNIFFEKWLRQMISYAVQVILTFAIIVMWIIVIFKMVTFFQELSVMIFPYDPLVVDAVYDPTNSWGICPPKIGTGADGTPSAKCQQGGFNACPPNSTVCSPPGGNWRADSEKLVPPSKVIEQGQFLYYVFYHLISLLLVTYAFTVLLHKAHEIASGLAGQGGGSTLMPGWGMRRFGRGGEADPGRIAEPAQKTNNVRGSAAAAAVNNVKQVHGQLQKLTGIRS